MLFHPGVPKAFRRPSRQFENGLLVARRVGLIENVAGRLQYCGRRRAGNADSAVLGDVDAAGVFSTGQSHIARRSIYAIELAGALDSFARDSGIRIVRYVTAEEIIQAPNASRIRDILKPERPPSPVTASRFFDCASSHAPFVFLSMVSPRPETD